MKLAGIVLCGGRSTRMGRPKAELPFGPESMLQRVVRLLGEVAAPIVVVGAPGQALPDLPVDIVAARDQRADRGPLEGLHAGLSALQGRADAAYVTGCDVPLLAAAFVRRLAELSQDHDVAVPVEGELHHPLAAVYCVSVAAKIRGLLDADRLRPVYLYDEVDTLRVPVDELRGVDPDLQTLANLNRPEDYLAALKAAGYERPADFR